MTRHRLSPDLERCPRLIYRVGVCYVLVEITSQPHFSCFAFAKEDHEIPALVRQRHIEKARNELETWRHGCYFRIMTMAAAYQWICEGRYNLPLLTEMLEYYYKQ